MHSRLIFNKLGNEWANLWFRGFVQVEDVFIFLRGRFVVATCQSVTEQLGLLCLPLLYCSFLREREKIIIARQLNNYHYSL